MRGLTKFDDKYFEKYSDKPVKIIPFSKRQVKIGDIYLDRLRKLLVGLDCRFMLRGSSLFGISGKGEVEVGIYPKEKNWKEVLKKLAKKYGEPENLEKHYARFNDEYEEVEIEIIVLKDHDAQVDLALHKYLVSKPKLLREYEKIKKRSAFSKREYMKEKNKFLAGVIEEIPDNYLAKN